ARPPPNSASTTPRTSRRFSSSSASSFLFPQKKHQIILATTLPNEILIEICSYLHPSDLYNLTLVCKRFRNLLWNKTNESTQLIWRTSRLNFIPHLVLPCPDGMSEQKYVWLMLLLNKCMFCEERDKRKLSMYWEFKMYCCQRCLAQRTVR
ncbi:5535_t:CDS:1, partial [Funneliformis mosseae]